MKEVGLFRKATGIASAALVLTTVLSATQAFAQTSNTIFPEGWDRSVRDRMFMRIGYIHMDPKTKASDTYDVTGPVIYKGELAAYRDAGLLNGVDREGSPFSNAADVLDGALGFNGAGVSATRYANGLGTPAGIKSRVGSAGTPAISLGYYFSDEHTWALEAFLLGLPLEIKGYGAGVNEDGLPVGVDGKHILTAKMLPPTFLLGRYFRDKNAFIRPYIGAAATYAVFFDAKPTSFLESHIGGKTTVSLKNAMGWGGFAGVQINLTESTHIGFNIGALKLKTQASLSTSQSLILSEDQLDPLGVPSVLRDYPRVVRNMIFTPRNGRLGDGAERVQVTDLMARIAEIRQNTNPTLAGIGRAGTVEAGNGLGTYVRRQDIKTTSTVLMLTVGHSF